MIDIKPKLERKQTSPKSPKQEAQNKQSANQGKESKTRHTGQDLAVPASSHHGLTVVTTTARGGSHGQPVVAATAVVALPIPNLLRFFCNISVFHAMPFRLLLVFGFKRRMNLD